MEKPKRTWSRRASIQFENAQAFIASYDELAADDFIDKALGLVDGLLVDPYIGRKVPEYDLESIRERICKAFRIISMLAKRKRSRFLLSIMTANSCQATRTCSFTLKGRKW